MNAAAPIYLDYAATTPVDPAVAAVMSACLTLADTFGNPASAHAFGRAAAQRVAAARAQVAALIGALPQEIVFTSGATESNNLAILGVAAASADRGRHVITMRTEHKAVLDPCRHLERHGAPVTYLAPEPSGLLRPQALAAALRPDTVLVSIMGANNETGVHAGHRGPRGAVSRARRHLPLRWRAGGAAHGARRAGAGGRPALVHGAQALWTEGHRCALRARRGARPRAAGELRRRPGTRPAPRHARRAPDRRLRRGLRAAAAVAAGGGRAAWASWRERLWRGLAGLGGVHRNGADAPRVPGIENLSFEGVEGESLFGALEGWRSPPGRRAIRPAASPPTCCARSGAMRASPRVRCASAWAASAPQPTSTGPCPRCATWSSGCGPSRRRGRLRPGGGSRPPAASRGRPAAQAEGTWVRFQLLTDGDSVKEARCLAFACPHTVDTAQWLCERLRGRSRARPDPRRAARLGAGARGAGRETGAAAGGRRCTACLPYAVERRRYNVRTDGHLPDGIRRYPR